MSVQNTVPYISLREVTVATTDGYAFRFEANKTLFIPNQRSIIAAVVAAGCAPVTKEDKPELKTQDDVKDEDVAERKIALFAALDVIIERQEPTDFTRGNVPQVRALETISGIEGIKNAERDAIWKEFKVERGL